MNNRILDFTEIPARLSVSEGCLAISTEDRPETRIPFTDIAVVVSANARNSFTQSVLSGISEAGAVLVTCDAKHLPIGMLVPIQSNFVQGERFLRQAKSAEPTRKRLWQEIVKAKIKAQAALLERLGRPEPGLMALASRVRSGDPANVEAQAARRYWPSVFGSTDFRRDRDAENINRHLNYGYAILRACTARALCAAGLHPSLGVNHHNRYDAFALANDLMEPFRPLVDEAVAAIAARDGIFAGAFTREHKAEILNAVTGSFHDCEETRSLFDWLSRCASSLVKIYAGEEEKLRVPILEPIRP